MYSDLKIFLSEIDSRVNENMEYSSGEKYLFDSNVRYCDGFNDTNPGTKGGWTIASYYNDKETLFSVYTIEKENFTNNEAELLGVLYAARFAKNNTTIYTDSQNTMLWIKRAGRLLQLKSRPDLTKTAKICFDIINEKHLKLEWVCREKNIAGMFNDKFNPIDKLF